MTELKDRFLLIYLILVHEFCIGLIQIPTNCLYRPSENPGQYEGCFTDQAQEVLPGLTVRFFDFLYVVNGIYDFEFMTNDVCIMICRDNGFQYAATEAGLQCFCGNDPYRYPAHFTATVGCSDRCYGDYNQNCGGQYRVSVYKTGLADVGSKRTQASFFRSTSIELSGVPIDVISGVSRTSCANACTLNNLCGVLSYKDGLCKLYGSFESGLCYENANGYQLSTEGIELYILK